MYSIARGDINDRTDTSERSRSNHTFCENLPLACLSTSIGWYSLVQVLEKVFHLTSALTLGELVTHAKFWRSTIVADGGG